MERYIRRIIKIDMKSMTNCCQALFAVVAFLFLPIYCMADKGFRYEAIEGICRYTVECHY